MNYGLKNEYDFVELLNNKYFFEFDEKMRCFLTELFEGYVDDDERFICWKNRDFQKADLFIKYKKITKSISLKCGNGNSVHSEPIQEFKKFLMNLHIPYKYIEKYMNYHYGYKKDENGRKDYSRVLSADEYKEYYQEELDEFNKYINKTKMIIEMVDRFLIKGRNSDYDIDALVSGRVDDFVWIMKYDLYDLILSKRNIEYTSPHVGCMTIGPRKRNIYSKTNYNKDRYVVCVRWNFIEEDIRRFCQKLK